MFGYPPHGPGQGGVPGPGGANINMEAPAAAGRWEVGIHPVRGGKGGCGIRGDGGVHLEKTEHGCAVHCYAISSVPVRGNGEYTGGTGGYAVVGAGGHIPDRGQGYGGRGGGIGRGWDGMV